MQTVLALALSAETKLCMNSPGEGVGPILRKQNGARNCIWMKETGSISAGVSGQGSGGLADGRVSSSQSCSLHPLRTSSRPIRALSTSSHNEQRPIRALSTSSEKERWFPISTLSYTVESRSLYLALAPHDQWRNARLMGVHGRSYMGWKLISCKA